MRKVESEQAGKLSNCPIYNMFGVHPRQLTADEAITATTDQRIASVWRFLVRKAIQFCGKLQWPEAANCDVEDVLMELYIELRNKDHKWEPSRGRYITFAGSLASRFFSSFRDSMRTVEAPRNSASRMKEYERDIETGKITDNRLETYGHIQRATFNYGSMDANGNAGGPLRTGGPSDKDTEVELREQQRLVNDAVTWGIMALTPFQSQVLGMSNGLWGKEAMTTGQIAERTGKTRDQVKEAKDVAFRKVKERLLSMGHPAVESDN